MWEWLGHHANKLEGIGAIVTALAALAALVVIPLQLQTAERIQRDQTAREIYREFLNLTVQKPELVATNYCALADDKQHVAYEAYVEYLLYTAEQMIASGAEWREPMASYLLDHLPYICAKTDWDKQSDGVFDLVMDLQKNCPSVPACTPG